MFQIYIYVCIYIYKYICVFIYGERASEQDNLEAIASALRAPWDRRVEVFRSHPHS